MDSNQQSHPSSLPSGANFTSGFFASFIDNSNSDFSPSSSHNTSFVADEPQALECSINQQKLKEFHARNLVCVSMSLLKRSAIHHWIAEKERLKRIEQLTPHRIAKTILKVFYSLSVKLQVKYSFSFRKMQRLYQQAKANEPVLVMNNSKQQATVCIGKPELSKKTPSVQSMGRVVNEISLQLMREGWISLRERMGFLERVQILSETVTLTLHLRMRQAFLSLSVQRQSLECNDISTIQEPRNRKDSFKMNNSTESIAIQKELLDQFSNQNEITSPRDPPRPKREPQQQLDRNDPRLLKFSKDVKRKTSPLQNSLPEPQEQSELVNQQSSHLMGGQGWQGKQTEGWQGKQTEELSMLRRHSATMNTSLCQSKSMIKKTRYPLQVVPERSYRVETGLIDDALPGVLNEGRRMKQFQDNSRIFKPKTIKHEQLRREFADFNDLFTLREVLAFVQGVRGEEKRGGISLARIKEKVNHKTQEEYNSKIKLRTDRQDKSREECTPIISSQKHLDHPHHHHHNLSRGPLQHTFASVRINTSQSRSRQDSRDRSRKAEFRIPSQIPKNFDYYVDKSLKKESKADKNTDKNTLRLSAIETDSKRRTPCISSSSRKKLQFNVVKAGSTRISADTDRRRPGETERRMPPKVELSRRSKEIKEGRQVREAQSPPSSCEYFMTFRDPPKKKMKKGILKNDN